MKLVISLIVILLLSSISYSQSEISESHALQIAQNVFNQDVPQDYRNEYVFTHIQKNRIIPEYYEVWWVRRVNNISVIGDRFYVNINSQNGDVVNKELKYSGLINNFIAQVSNDQAKWLVERYYSSVKEPPQLKIIDRKLIWYTQLTNGAEIGIYADTGESKILSVPLGVSVQQISTTFNPIQYFVETQMPWIVAVLAVVGIGGFIYYKKALFIPKK